MAIDLKAERLLTLTEAAGLLPRRRRGRKVHASTLSRWALKGNHGVKLETLRFPSGLMTSAEALQRFAEQLSERSQPPVVRTAGQRERSDNAADRELTDAGL